MYARFRISFWKQDPPKPTEAFRNLGPMRLSVPMECATCVTSAPVASHRADMALMEEMRWARKALAASLESSADQRLAVMICSLGTQLAYTSARASTAAWPSSFSILPPMRTRSGLVRSAMAVPSARNSGLERMSNWTLESLQLRLRTFSMASAVRTGTVDFSTMILLSLDSAAMVRAADSQ